MLTRICSALSLGEMTAPPLSLSGGYTHRMFRLDTTTGRYALKLLNPEIMQRPEAMENYRTAEGFEALLEARKLPILPALTIGGRKLQCVDGQHLYVFDYYEGHVLKDEEITPAHCAKMGEVLARIHCAAPIREGDALSPPTADSALVKGLPWRTLAEALLASTDARGEGEMLLGAAPLLEKVTAAAEGAAHRLPHMEALCHNDMDAKNVLWQGEDFRIIDLECLGYANPLQEMLDLAVSWAGWTLDEGKFKAFVSAYYRAGGAHPADAALLYDSRRNHIDWLAYNARRALFDDPAERRIGREQARETIGKIAWDQQNRAKILGWMEETPHV